jgi:hypothetical protein
VALLTQTQTKASEGLGGINLGLFFDLLRRAFEFDIPFLLSSYINSKVSGGADEL